MPEVLENNHERQGRLERSRYTGPMWLARGEICTCRLPETKTFSYAGTDGKMEMP